MVDNKLMRKIKTLDVPALGSMGLANLSEQEKKSTCGGLLGDFLNHKAKYLSFILAAAVVGGCFATWFKEYKYTQSLYGETGIKHDQTMPDFKGLCQETLESRNKSLTVATLAGTAALFTTGYELSHRNDYHSEVIKAPASKTS